MVYQTTVVFDAPPDGCEESREGHGATLGGAPSPGPGRDEQAAPNIDFQRTFHLDVGELAVFLGAASVAVVVTEAPWGMAADRFGERRVLLTGIGITVLALAALGIAGSLSVTPPLWMLASLLFIAAGAGGAVTGPS